MRTTDLHWLWRKDKWLTYPKLLYVNKPDLAAGGVYLHPWPVVYDYQGMEMQPKTAHIIINTAFNHDSKETECTLAHEWRHHYQYYSGDKSNKVTELADNESYDDFIKRYFLHNEHEMDALRYSLKVANCDYMDYWYRGLCNQNN